MRLITLLFALFAFSAPVQAFDITKMTPEEEVAFGEAVRTYMLAHPDLLLELIDQIESDRAASRATADASLIEKNSNALFADANSFVGGNPNGDIVIVEFLDYKCGYCKQAFPEVAKVIQTDGNIRFVIKEFPILGEQSVLAARFAISVKLNAGDEAYGKIHDTMMTFRGDFNDASLRRLADQAGLATEAIMSGMNAPEVDAVLNANHALARALEIDGTPGFILGNQVLRGYVPHDALVQLVDQARS